MEMAALELDMKASRFGIGKKKKKVFQLKRAAKTKTNLWCYVEEN